MKGRDKSFVTRIALLIVALCLISCMFVACTSGTVERIEVDASSNAGYYMLEGFNISTLKILVYYEDGSANPVNVDKSMLTTAAKNELTTSGQKEITINYKGKTCIASFYLAEEGEQIVAVTFKDANGNKIATVKTLAGGSVADLEPEHEEIDGQQFRGWVDADDNVVDLTSISSSITLTAAYTTDTVRYRVVFKDYQGKTVSDTMVDSGSSVYPPTYNKPASVKAFSWTSDRNPVSFPIVVNSNITVNMSVEMNYYSVSYAYAYESERTKVTYFDGQGGRTNYHEEIEYGKSVANFNAARDAVSRIGTIVESPTASTVIYRDTSFIFILASEKVNITVYNNEDMSLVRVPSTQYALNATYTFPMGTPVAVAGKSFAGWKLTDGNKVSTKTYKQGESWTVDATSYGKNIKVIPCYEAAYATVTYTFNFAVKGQTQKYRYDLIVSDVYETTVSIINYAEIVRQFETLTATRVNDGTATGVAVSQALSKYRISTVTYNGTPFTVDGSVLVNSSQLTFIVDLSSADNGTEAIEYDTVLVLCRPVVVLENEEDYVVGWKYGAQEFTSFPMVVDASAFDASELTYKTHLNSSYTAIDATSYTENTANYEEGVMVDLTSGYFFGLEATGMDGTFVEGTNIYIPNTRTIAGGADPVVRPVVSVGTKAFSVKSTYSGYEVEKSAAYVIAGVSENLIRIGEGAFAGCNLYGTVTFDNLTVIGANAFNYAVLQGEIAFPSLVSVGNSAFEKLNFFNRGAETTVDLSGASLTALSENMFYSVYGALTVELNVDKCAAIGTSAFELSVGLGSVEGVGNIRSVGARAFGKTALEIVDLPNVETVGERAFYSMPNLTTVILGSNGTLTQNSIDLAVIEGSLNVEAVVIGRQDASLPQAAGGEANVTWDEDLTTVTNTIVGSDVYNLKEIKLPKSLTTVSVSVFGTFPYIERVVVPASSEKFYTDAGVLYSVTATETTKEYALAYYPRNKQGDYKASLPEGATKYVLSPVGLGEAGIALLDLSDIGEATVELGSGVFDAEIVGVKLNAENSAAITALSAVVNVYVTGVTEEQFAEAVTDNGWDDTKVFMSDDFDYYFDTENKTLYHYSSVDGVRTAKVVKGYQYARSITIPASITVDGTSYSVTEIAPKAFFGFTELTTLTVNASLYKMPYTDDVVLENAFGDATHSCDKLTTITFAGWTTIQGQKEVKQTSFKYTKWYDDHSIIYAGGEAFGYNENATTKVITAEDLSGSGFTTSIPAEFFAGANITSISFPSTITSIGKEAFKNCTLLETVGFGRIQTIGEGAFTGCTSLKSAIVPDLISLGASAFEGCSSLEEFSASGLTQLPVKAFLDCVKLEKVTLPKVEIFLTDSNKDSYAFQNCSELSGISLPVFKGDVIPGYAFAGCGKLHSFDFSNAMSTVKTIGTHAFFECSGMEYVLFGPSVVNIELNAFAGCGVLNVEIPYSVGGLYIATNLTNTTYVGTNGTTTSSVEQAAFHADTKFFIDGQVDKDATFLRDYDNVRSVFPTISFDFYNDSNVDYTNLGNSLGMNDVRDKIYFDENDLVAPNYEGNGLTFVGWSKNRDSYEEVRLPAVFTENTNLYARYISSKRGTLTNDDVSYVYLIAEKPELVVENDLAERRTIENILFDKVIKVAAANNGNLSANKNDYCTEGYINDETLKLSYADVVYAAGRAGYDDPAAFLTDIGLFDEFCEEVKWYYTLTKANGSILTGAEITSFPFVYRDLEAGSRISLYAEVTGHRYVYLGESASTDCIRFMDVKTKVEFGRVGEEGFAIVNYSSTDNRNVVLPELYSNGDIEAPIIVLYAGAFGASSLTKIDLPDTIRVMLKGKVSGSSFVSDGTFNNGFTEIGLPEDLVYIEEGLFAGLSNLSLIDFGSGDNLRYVSHKTFVGTDWYRKAVLAAESGANNGFVMAGKVAIEYVGDGYSVFKKESNSTVQTTYTEEDGEFTSGISIGWELTVNDVVKTEQTLLVKTINNDGSYVMIGYSGNDGAIEDGIYVITLTAADSGLKTVKLYIDASNGAIKKVEFSAAVLGADVLACRLIVADPSDTITLPTEAVKVADGILKDNTDMIKLAVNPNLVYIGEEAFYGSSLTSVTYTSEAQASSKIAYVGKNAFARTPWFTSLESAIIGTVYLKHNNTGEGERYDGNSKKYAITIPAYVTKIATGAFENATALGNVRFAGNNVKVIGSYAFAGSGLENVTLPSSVIEVQRGAFKNATSLSDAVLKDTRITALKQETFIGCTVLKNVSLPATVTAIEKDAFRRAAKLASISAAGLTDVNVDCGSVVEIVGGEVNVVGSYDGSALVDTAWYSPVKTDGDQFIVLGSVLVKYVMGSVNEEKATTTGDKTVEITVPSSVHTILRNAFKGNVYITSLTVPASVKSIGQSAFEDCTALETVVFENGSQLEEIEACAFKECHSLSTVVLPDGLKKIGAQAFYNADITTAVRDDRGNVISDDGFSIPNAVTFIGNEAFAQNTSLTYLNLGNNIEYIGEKAFYVNTAGKQGVLYKVNWSVVVSEDNLSFEKLTESIKTLSSLGTDLNVVFQTGADIIIRLYFPNATMSFIDTNKNVWTTDESNMYICKDRDEIEMKDGKEIRKCYPKISLSSGETPVDIFAEVIGSQDELGMPMKSGYTFVEWDIETSGSVLVPLTYPYEVRGFNLSLVAKYVNNNPERNSEEINYTYDAQGSITSVNAGEKTLYVPETVDGIKITRIDLNGVNEDVEKIVFTKAENFKGMTTNIFVNYTSLKEVLVPNDAASIDFVVENVRLSKTEVNGSVTTGDYQVVYAYSGSNSSQGSKLIAFIGRADGMEFTVPTGVTEICKGAFKNSGLKSIYLPSTVTTIQQDAFNKELKSIKIQKNINITNATAGIFVDRSSAGSLWSTPANVTNYSDYVEVKGLRYENKNSDGVTEGYFYSLGNILLGYSYIGGTDLTMPTKLNEFDVTVLASELFTVGSKKATFNRVILPLRLKKINLSAFANCDITVGFEENAVISGVINPRYSQLTDIANDVFTDMTFYKNANMGMLIVGHVLVKAQYTADRIVVPTNIESIMEGAFSNSQATTIELPNTLVKIGPRAFYAASFLVSITIPNSVTDIGSSVFQGCSRLSTVTFDTVNSALRYIGDSAFTNCTSLTTIALPAKLQKIGSMAFYGCNRLTTITFDGYEMVTDINGHTEAQYVSASELEAIGEAAFSGCTRLTEISIPNGVTKIAKNTFQACESLLRVKFDIANSKLAVIEEKAFVGCIKLGSVLENIVEDPTTEQESYTTDLVTLKLPNALTRVENNAFENCSGLWGIQFNYNIDYLGANVFNGCNNLVKINFYRATAPVVQANTFEIGSGALFRLRIYVYQSPAIGSSGSTYGSTMENYITKWSALGVTIDERPIKYHIYEIGDLPTLTMINGSNTVTYEGKEVYIALIGSMEAERNWEYASLSQKQNWYYGGVDDYSESDTVRPDTKVINYGSDGNGGIGCQEYVVSAEVTYLVIIVDYDEVTIRQGGSSN